MYGFIDKIGIKMNERNSRLIYHSRVSPSPGKGATPAYTLCPMNDPDLMMPGSNVLSIPLSAITLPTKNPTKDATGLYPKKTYFFSFLFHFLLLLSL